MVVILDRPVMLVSPVNVTPALVIVQSLVHSNTPIVSGVALVQLHSVEITRSKQTVKVIKAKKKFHGWAFYGDCVSSRGFQDWAFMVKANGFGSVHMMSKSPVFYTRAWI
jgi:hypothetical protein